MLKFTAEKQVIRAFCRDGDPRFRTINLFNTLNTGTRRHKIARLNLEIRWRELDFAGAFGLIRKERDVPFAAADRVGHLARSLEGDELERNVEALCDPAREVGCDAGRFSGGGILGREDEVTVVDSGPE